MCRQLNSVRVRGATSGTPLSQGKRPRGRQREQQAQQERQEQGERDQVPRRDDSGGGRPPVSGRPVSVPISRMVEGAETELFKSQFPIWDPPKKLSFTNFDEARKERSLRSGNVLSSRAARAEACRE